MVIVGFRALEPTRREIGGFREVAVESLPTCAEPYLDGLGVVGRIFVPRITVVAEIVDIHRELPVLDGLHQQGGDRFPSPRKHIHAVCLADIVGMFRKFGQPVLRVDRGQFL